MGQKAPNGPLRLLALMLAVRWDLSRFVNQCTQFSFIGFFMWLKCLMSWQLGTKREHPKNEHSKKKEAEVSSPRYHFYHPLMVKAVKKPAQILGEGNKLYLLM